jgi:peptidoglycan LD-endopeptidase LytH
MMYARPMRSMGMLVLATMAAGCAPALTERAESSPRGRYERELRRIRPHGETLAAQWTAKGDATARAALRVTLPHHEIIHFTAGVPGATAYRFRLRSGDRFQTAVEMPPGRQRGVFLELFEVVSGPTERLLLIARSDQGANALRSLIPRTGEYVLLLQPRVEEGGRHRIAVWTGNEGGVVAGGRGATTHVAAALAFPVHGHGMRSIYSVFGDPRDGGRRAHHGVDIFAARGTPVLAAADGRITNVALTPVGGRVIWQIADGSGLELYYAHLDQQHVRAGQRVRAGDVIGTVGNTGNARTTPPHLHFGVYGHGRSPLDPSPMLAQGVAPAGRTVARETPARAPATAAPAPLGSPEPMPPPSAGDATVPAGPAAAGVDESIVGSWLRTQIEQAPLRATPSTDAQSVTTLAYGTPVRLVGGTTAWYRVTLPDGPAGFLPASAVA